MSARSHEVTVLISNLDISIQEAVETLRDVILSAHTQIADHVKWNSPAFFYTGEMASFDPKEYKRDIAVLNLHRNRLLLVLPSGAGLTDNDNLLEGKYTDGRRTITFKDKADIENKASLLQALLQQWVAMVDK